MPQQPSIFSPLPQLSPNAPPLPPRDVTQPMTPGQKIMAALTGMVGFNPYAPNDQEADKWRAGGELASMAALPLAGVLGKSATALEEAIAARRIQNPIKVFHGSGHDFDKFSMDAIGTGEGAQGYGHGLYFAENPEVAKQYANKLAGTRPATMEELRAYFQPGVVRKNSYGEEDKILSFTENGRGDWSVHSQPLRNGKPNFNYPNGVIHSTSPSLADLTKAGIAIAPRPQGIYEVNLHTTPDQLLDWDKTLAQQSPDVRQRLKALGLPDDGTSATGKDAYRVLAMQSGDRHNLDLNGLPGAEYATEKLNQIGIPGLKYLDAFSRNPNITPTHNFVIWEPEIIDIAKKYGITLPMAAALMYKNQQAPTPMASH